ncbi:unnamed protein product [Absidia cylindrospora]
MYSLHELFLPPRTTSTSLQSKDTLVTPIHGISNTFFIRLPFLKKPDTIGSNNGTSEYTDNAPSMISNSDLDSTTVIGLDALAKVSKQLGLRKHAWSSYQSALSRDTMTMMNLELEKQDLDELSWTIEKRKKATELELETLKELLANMRHHRKEKEEKMVQQWQEEAVKLREQTRLQTSQYEETMEKTRARIDGATVTDVRLLESQTVEFEKQLDLVKKQLEKYYDMPPDTDWASLKMQEKLDIMTNLEKRRERLLEEIARSMY